jgi:hypothetical protein
VSDEDSDAELLPQSPSLSLVKTATPATYDAVGDVIAYAYLVSNSGNVSLDGPVTVSDDKATVTCPAVNTVGNLDDRLDPGEAITCTATYIVTQADLDAGSLTNIASATDGVNTSPTDTVTVPATQTPSLALVKTASPATYSAAGQAINYSYLLTNSGNVTLSGPFSVSDDKATVTCPATASLAPGASLTCTATYPITQDDLDAGSVTNTAQAKAFFGQTEILSDQEQATVTATQTPGLSLVKTAAPANYATVGQSISYNYEVTNSGNVTLSGPFSVTDDKATVTCPATASLAPGASLTCTATYLVTQADLDAGSITNTATASNGAVTSQPDTETVYATAHPNLGLVKSATPATYSAVNDTISYEYELTNIGNVALSAPFVVTDDKAAVTCPQTPNPLPVGGTLICTASHLVTQADLDAGFITNTASATAQHGGNLVTSNEAAATVSAVASPALAIDKSVQESAYAAVGDELHYSYVVRNAGNVTLHAAITVNDDKAAVTCPDLPVGGLAPGASITCEATYIVTQADLDAGSLTNIASATDGVNTSPTDTVTVPATQTPSLALVKTASPATYSAAGQAINYSYLLTNSGNVTLNGPFSVSDDKTTVICPAVNTVGNLDDRLDPGEAITCTASYTITLTDLNNGSLTNVAQAFAGQIASNQDSETVTAVQNSGLSLVKTAMPATYDAVGDVIAYAYLVSNNGNVSLDGPVTVSDDKATVTCPAVNTVGNLDARLDPGEAITCTANYTIKQSDVDAGSLTNVAQAFAGQVASNQDSETVTAVQNSGLSLVKTATPATYDAVGDVIAYAYLVSNNGNVSLDGPVTVSDDKATVTCPAVNTVGNLDARLDPGEAITCTANYTIKQSDVDAGSLTNVAQAFAGQVASNQDSETVTAVQNSGLSLVKTATPATYDAVGDVIAYAYLVSNNGNVSLDGPVTVSDDKTTVTCPAVNTVGNLDDKLDPGEAITCTASYTITLTDLNNGSLTNVAQAFAGQIASNQDSETVTAVQNSGLSLVKTATPATYDAVGDVIAYAYLVSNNGNVSLDGPVTVSDDKATVTCPAVNTVGNLDARLDPGEAITCTANYTIKQSDVDAGSLTNVAQAFAGQVASNQDSETVTYIPALSSLTVTKIVNWNGVSADPAKTFQVCIAGPSFPGGDCRSIGKDGGVLTWTGLLPGNYQVTETDPGSEWTVVVTGSPAVAPVGGGQATATVTNTRKLGSLEVLKVVDWAGTPADNQKTFEICISGPSLPEGDCRTVDFDGGVLLWENLLPGAYQVAEKFPGDEWSVNIDGSPATVPSNGGKVSITVTNTRLQPARITVTKRVTTTEESTWSFTLLLNGADARTVTELSPTAAWENLTPNRTYTLSEVEPGAPWDQGAFVCTLNGSPTGDVLEDKSIVLTVAPGDIVTCEKYNVDLVGTDLDVVDEPVGAARLYLPLINH